MIDLYYWPTPNGHKITMFLEEAGVDYTYATGVRQRQAVLEPPDRHRRRKENPVRTNRK
jgi:glutathione S-transferase